jgi:Tol biopolymer transport system component
MKRIYLLVVLLTGIVQTSTAGQFLTPESLWKLTRVSDVRLSPDGAKVVYSVRNIDLTAAKGNTDLWLVEISTGSTRKLAGDSVNETSPRWSVDGSRVFFLSDAGGSS